MASQQAGAGKAPRLQRPCRRVVGLGALVASLGGGSLPLPPDVAHFDLWVMLAALVACLPVFLTGREIARWEGAMFLAYYVAYTAYLVMAAQRHDGAQAFGDAMLKSALSRSHVHARASRPPTLPANGRRC